MKSHLPVLLLLIPLFTAISMPMVALRRPRWCRPMALWAAVRDERRRHRQSGARRAFRRNALCLWRLDARRWASSGSPTRLASVVMVAVSRDRRWSAWSTGLGQLAGLGRPRHAALRADPAAAVGTDRRGVRRRSVQRVRVPGSCDAGHLRPGRHGRRQGAGLRIPVSHPGEHRRHLLPARRQLLYAATGTLNMADLAARLARAGGIQRGDHRRGVHVPRPGDQDGPDAVSRLAARRLHLGAGRRFPAHLGPGHQGVAVCLGPDHVLGGRCRPGLRAGPGASRLLDAGRGRRRSSARFSPSSSTTSSACSPMAAYRTSG